MSNTLPMASAPVSLLVDESAAVIMGQVTATDPDPGATVTFSIAGGAAPPAGFMLDADGNYRFDPTDPAYDHLNVGDIEVLTIPVVATDDQGGTDTTQIEIVVNGVNDAPVAGPPINLSVDVDAAVVNGQVTATDVDDGSTASFAIAGGGGAPAGFMLSLDGSFSFDPMDAAYAALNAGESMVLMIDVLVTDDQGATDMTQIEITVSGTNNIPVALDDSYITFGNTVLGVGVAPPGVIAVLVGGSVLSNDADLDADALSVTLESAPGLGSVALNADGSFSYSPMAGQTSVTDSFTYRVSDATSSSTGTVNINITRRVWYVDNRSAAGSGTSDDPFASVNQVEAAVADGDTVYVAYGDGSSTGLDNGLTLGTPNVELTGEGVALIVNGTLLASAGMVPTLTNASGPGLTLNAADNARVTGLSIDGALTDGLLVNDSTGVELEGIVISNSGESAIEGLGADVGLSLTDVTIDTVDVGDASVSDDAILIRPTSSVSLVMQRGFINGVPGQLGDGIVLENATGTNPVSMMLDVRGVSFSNIGQDGIKLDNDQGVLTAQIGGATIAEGNSFSTGFRGVQIQTGADPIQLRTNVILIQNNTISCESDCIQVRHIDDLANLSILDNVLNRVGIAVESSDLIDVQAEFMATPEARINRNQLNDLGGSDGLRLRALDGATLTMEALDNAIDGADVGLDLDVLDLTGMSVTTLNASILNNTLSNIVAAAMLARNADANAVTCMDLQGNSVLATASYELDAVQGSFGLTAASQAIVFNPQGGSTTDPGTCPVPTF